MTRDEDEREPDYRFTLANERTFLAWIRTCLALLAAGVAVVQFTPDLGPRQLRVACGVFLALLATVCATGGLLRWRQVQQAMRRDQPLPTGVLTWMLAAGLSCVAIVVAVVLTAEGVRA